MSSPAAERNGRKDEGKEGTPMVAEQAEVVPAQKRKRSVSRSPAPPSPHRRRLSPPRGPRYDLPPRGPRNDARHDRPAVPDVDLARARERERQLAEQMEKRTEEPEKKPFDAKAEFERLMETRAGGTYVPPARLRALQAQFTDKNTKEYQRMHWEALKKSINGLINKVNTSNIKMIIPELFGENLVRGRGLYARSIMKAQAASLPFTPVLTALTAVVNTKLPQVGELLLTRLIVQFRKAFKRNDKSVCLSSTTFIAHLCNQAVAHEIVALQILSLLLERPTDDSVEVAVGFIREVGAYLAEVSPKANNGVFDRFRAILHEGQIDKRVQYMIEVLFQVRKDKYKDHPIIPEGLDLVEEDDQITHYISLDDELDVQEGLGVFKFDPEFEENEERYKEIKAEILGDSGEESGSDDEDESDEEETEGAAVVDEAKRQEIQDQTNTNLVNLRRTIYLTIMSSVDYEECCHKLMRINIPEGQQIELANMIVECCSQERTYSRFYGLMGERFCKLNRMWTDTFQSAFQTYYETIHRYESNKLRNIAKFFGHLLSTEAIHWHVLSCIHLNEDETTSSSRIFIKILFQDLQESLGLNALKAVMADPMLEECFGGLFPRDESRNTRFAINYFTSIGLGAVTEGLREWLKGNPTMRVPFGPALDLKVTPIPANAGQSPYHAAFALSHFLTKSNRPRSTLLLTGAGVSVDSGIPDYRGPTGTYRVNKSYRPIFFSEFTEKHTSRQRYWSRSFLGYPPVQRARPNDIHKRVAGLWRHGHLSQVITQNVDGLHTASSPDVPTLELHGSLHKVLCLSCRGHIHRQEFQEELKRLNPDWAELLRMNEKELQINPDGDVQLPKERRPDGDTQTEKSYEHFRYPACKKCDAAKTDAAGAWVEGGGILKPSVIFFGEQVPESHKIAAEKAVEQADRVLVIGSSLATYSAFRLIRAAKETGKSVAVVNWGGPIRGEGEILIEEEGDLRIPLKAGAVLAEVESMLMEKSWTEKVAEAAEAVAARP
ncbi:DHS-like NAD/FAD-binding domain-containing protein [Saitoella complicata NRRL Y-17804]|nr:DHS-like NAD/FAD-binding domain-containing protein [Saitoella complicata NRRL Y-17804]ODQ51383.1 DHS-like NAD/FAD-binding domain-containing protein [Saitoella complicata NRRL Y-17804]